MSTRFFFHLSFIAIISAAPAAAKHSASLEQLKVKADSGNHVIAIPQPARVSRHATKTQNHRPIKPVKRETTVKQQDSKTKPTDKVLLFFAKFSDMLFAKDGDKDPDGSLRQLLESAERYERLVRYESEKQDLDPKLAMAIISRESRFKPRAESNAACIGLMQLKPSTAIGLGWEPEYTYKGKKKILIVDELYEPAVNVHYGVMYIKQMLTKYAPREIHTDLKASDLQKPELKRSIAAYNAGETAVDKYLKQRKMDIPPFRETREYVKKVTEYFALFEEKDLF